MSKTLKLSEIIFENINLLKFQKLFNKKFSLLANNGNKDFFNNQKIGTWNIPLFPKIHSILK